MLLWRVPCFLKVNILLYVGEGEERWIPRKQMCATVQGSWFSIFPRSSDCIVFFFLIYSRYVIIYLWFHISICDDVAAVILWQSNEQLLQELLTFSILLFCLDAEAYKIEGNPIKPGRQLLVWIVSKKMTGEKMKKPVKLEVLLFLFFKFTWKDCGLALTIPCDSQFDLNVTEDSLQLLFPKGLDESFWRCSELKINSNRERNMERYMEGLTLRNYRLDLLPFGD